MSENVSQGPGLDIPELDGGAKALVILPDVIIDGLFPHG